MDRFKFPLQKLLDIRIDNEEQSKLKLMEAQRQQNQAQAKLNDLKVSYTRYNVIDKNMSVAEQKMKNNYLSALNSGIDRANEELLQKNALVDSRREDVKTKQIERKTVEIIKDKRYENFKREQDRKEQVQIDEFALYAYIRNTERG
jgi:flagellar FliJ protein